MSYEITHNDRSQLFRMRGIDGRNIYRNSHIHSHDLLKVFKFMNSINRFVRNCKKKNISYDIESYKYDIFEYAKELITKWQQK